MYQTVRVTLKDIPDVQFDLDITKANQSSYLKEIISNLCTKDKSEISVEIDSTQKAFEKVVAYLDHYTDNTMPEPYKYKDTINDWDTTFMNYTVENRFELFDLVNTANMLGIPSLISLCASTIAQIINGYSHKEIRQFLGVEKHIYTPTEKVILRSYDCPWGDDNYNDGDDGYDESV